MINSKKITKAGIVVSLLLLMIFMTYSCSNGKNNQGAENEVRQAEKDFQQLLVAEGSASAFYKFASDSAVIKRENDSLIFGKEAIKKYYSNPFYNHAVALWAPDYIGISEDGTMAYTFGKYEWTFTDSTGKKSNYHGIFHTVWKKMSDGSWKFVWD